MKEFEMPTMTDLLAVLKENLMLLRKLRMPSLAEWQHRFVSAAKACLFAGRGEPYRVGSKTLRFVPGTRPVRLRYQTSENMVNRYDAVQLTWLLDNLSDGDIALDVGANGGQCTIAMAERCGGAGSVIAFEPNPHARALLRRNINLNPRIKSPTVESFACSDVADGEADLYQNGNSANSGLVPFTDRNTANDENQSFRVPVTSLDSYLSRRHLPEPRVVKIDTEGAEIRILQGAHTLLASGAAILCELHPYAWPQFGNSFIELKELVARYGRRMRYLDEASEVADDAHYGIVMLERIKEAPCP
ncbi:MAG: FkbM family methyltransferase [Xanthobacteraceae bacterium]